ncbi:Retrovirus-related Gag polyprotein from transposon opus [Eumeta japonica]|uniref:Retrovirus-related Gag polyprotein from transposon opus n=1 Tax=Eumeta variegata TaxID=151549 RepID=A0A4C1SRU6_EUMVA|nr:Retrovirus-related Gag polyprotein from transposon opus [Eumeta japonica]
MEELKTTVTNLTGAINRFVEQIKSVEARIGAVEVSLSNDALGQVLSRLERLENGQAAAVGNVMDEGCLQRPRTEADLKDISRLPDSVKELRTFEGNPTQYVSWVHSVETILKDFEIVKDKPIYRAIIQSVRQKIVGAADTACVVQCI